MSCRRIGLAVLLASGALVFACTGDLSPPPAGAGGAQGDANSTGTNPPGTGGAAGGAGAGGSAGGSAGTGTGGATGNAGRGGAGAGASGGGGAAGSGGAAGAPARGGSGGASAGRGGVSGIAGTSGHGGMTGSAGSAGAGTGGGAGAAGNAGNGGNGGLTGTGGAGGTQPFKGVANSPCAVRMMLSTSWYYNWTQSADTCAGGGGEFIPMIWGHTGSEQSASGITSSITTFVNKGYGNVLGFNEPDNTGQSNMTVATAISLWPAFNNPAIKIGTPATSANSNGQTWFTSFMNMLNADASLRADFVAIHWYGWNAGSCDANASQLESYIKSAEGWAGTRPIWLTEWGCLNNSAPDTQTVVNFYKGAVTMFAKHPRLVRYAWYPWSTNLDLVDSGGALTALGVAYAAAPSYK